MKVFIVSSCTGKKDKKDIDSNPFVLNENNIDDFSLDELKEKGFSLMKPKDRYTGKYHGHIREAIGKLRNKGFTITWKIISAAYGVLDENKPKIPNYNFTFNDMSEKEIIQRGKHKGFGKQLLKFIMDEKPDFILIALPKKYCLSIKDELSIIEEKHNNKSWIIRKEDFDEPRLNKLVKTINQSLVINRHYLGCIVKKIADNVGTATESISLDKNKLKQLIFEEC